MFLFFFFKQKTAYEMRISDWSSDVCSSDLAGLLLVPEASSQPVVAGEASFGMMMVFVLLTFGGWNEAVYLSAELRDGRRRMGHAMILGLIVVAVLYLPVNLAYLRAQIGRSSCRDSGCQECESRGSP